MSKETVRLDISVQIDEHDDDYDTGLSVVEWNAMTAEQRGNVYREVWLAMAEGDSGGVRVLTEGAEAL